MKTLLLTIVVVSLIASALGAQCLARNGDLVTCRGPVIVSYTDRDCKGTATYVAYHQGRTYRGGLCYPGSDEWDGSTKYQCGKNFVTYSYPNDACKGAYSKAEVPTDKCINIEDGEVVKSQKYLCASASTATVSVALLALLALVALLL